VKFPLAKAPKELAHTFHRDLDDNALDHSGQSRHRLFAGYSYGLYQIADAAGESLARGGNS